MLRRYSPVNAPTSDLPAVSAHKEDTMADRLEQWSRHVRATGMFEMFEGEEWADYLSTQVYAG